MKMKSLLLWAFIYLVLGCGFTIAAISTAHKTLLNFTTILFIIVAAFDIRTAIRYIGFYRKSGLKSN